MAMSPISANTRSQPLAKLALPTAVTVQTLYTGIHWDSLAKFFATLWTSNLISSGTQWDPAQYRPMLLVMLYKARRSANSCILSCTSASCRCRSLGHHRAPAFHLCHESVRLVP